ncbi:peptidoglycan/xylan/chitin deacetylase (PgdA/CDA1 family) [Mucilaginibacter gracilis]|uniref:Peptidoglycan/xylan/chitin deacetylase (PgdA/CDA1 family) n=1 Tax=Mucilaginibacter gracilis TaxID=423350 RepID=A0A495J3K9_9SPHI|nr:polysaccharide deacetylase family protein [Mucilaginibacter gracilis]RKR83413.1 peptidoglycan/xylan/chitin deacetylase (PgdA/CDA1 family) [Mucilaginibacter gracilis]
MPINNITGMFEIRKSVFTLLFLLTGIPALAQDKGTWNNKQCAVVLTYDDALDIDLDNVIPALDSLKLKGTFYLIGSSPVINKRLGEWRTAAMHGHELGNHSLFHPCSGGPTRSWITPENDLSKYTVARAVNEIRQNNTLLKAIDGKNLRTFAFPCGDLTIGGENFYTALKPDFAGARGVSPGLQTATDVDLDNIKCYAINGQTADYMINLVKQAQQSHTLLVFLFHGVGGGHNLNVSLADHSKLIHYLKANEKEIWIAPMVDVATRISALQASKGSAK